MPAAAAAGVYALLTDGTTTEIRPPGPEDGGVATLLLDHLGPAARSPGVRVFTALVLPFNTQMLQVVADAGLSVRRHRQNGVIKVTVSLPGDDADPWREPYLDAKHPPLCLAAGLCAWPGMR
jgi:hypothetical protein